MRDHHKITEIDHPPQVGKVYLVPHVYYVYTKIHRRIAWWPVIGPKHDDVEHLNFDADHYHLDIRFLPARRFSDKGIRRGDVYRRYSSFSRFAGSPLSAFSPTHFGPGMGGPLPAPVLRPARCIAADVGFVPLSDDEPKFVRFHAAFHGRKCGRDADGRLICPHKGAPLATLVPDRRGHVTCPLHGLTIDTIAGTVVPRLKLERRVW